MTQEQQLLYDDAPIRQAIESQTLCKNCTRILLDCSDIPKQKSMINSYLTITECEQFQDYRIEE